MRSWLHSRWPRLQQEELTTRTPFPFWLLYCLCFNVSSWILLWCSYSPSNFSGTLLFIESVLVLFKNTSALCIKEHFHKHSGGHWLPWVHNIYYSFFICACKEQKTLSAIASKSTSWFFSHNEKYKDQQSRPSCTETHDQWPGTWLQESCDGCSGFGYAADVWPLVVSCMLECEFVGKLESYREFHCLFLSGI